MARQSLIRLGEVERFPQNYTLARTIVESYFLFATEMNDFDREALIAVALPQSLRNDPQRAERIAWFFVSSVRQSLPVCAQFVPPELTGH
jgi:hypothetical protein